MRRELNSMVLLVLAAAVLVSSAGAQSSGTLSGSVLLDGKQPLVGAVVLFSRVPELTKGPGGHIVLTGATFSGEATTDAGGNYQTDGIPVGDYYLCATGTMPNHLRSCDWGGPDTFRHVTGTVSDLPASLSVQTGSLLTVTVNDPTGRIQVNDPTGINAPPTNLTIRVKTGRYYYRTAPPVKQGNQWTYTVAVPIGVSVSLFVDSALGLADSSGIAVPTRQPVLPFVAQDASGVALAFVVP
jgi:hypothetical protein